MGILHLSPLRRQHFYHGGCRVLTVLYQRSAGSAPAALHLAKITDRLLQYAEQALLPDAVCELEALARTGDHHRFRRRQYCIRIQEKDGKRGKKITVTTELWTGDTAKDRTLLYSAVLETLWDQTGSLQLSVPHGKMRNIHSSP